MALLDGLFGWHAVDRIFADRTTIQRMLDFEAALARAEASTGVIPASAAGPIVSKCHANLFDLAAISEAGAHAGNLAIPLIKELTAKVSGADRKAAGFVHWGATSQDVIDTATVLQLREALTLFETDLALLRDVLCDLAIHHRSTPLAGRTWMQHGIPIVLGLKFAGWADTLGRDAARIHQAREQVQVLQFGGAAGTLASLQNKGLTVAAALAEQLDLSLPAMPWHTHRDRFAQVATTLGLLAGTLGKIARDLSLLSQSELGEISEPSTEGRGGSLTMPQKRNPVTAAIVLAAATRVPALVSTILTAMVQENERGLGGWHAEWETLPQLIRLAGGALHHLAATIPALEISPGRMQRNLTATHGLIFAEAVTMALARLVGKSQAHEMVESYVREALANREHLRDIVRRHQSPDGQLSPDEIDRLFDPLRYLGVAQDFIDRVATLRSSSPDVR